MRPSSVPHENDTRELLMTQLTHAIYGTLTMESTSFLTLSYEEENNVLLQQVLI